MASSRARLALLFLALLAPALANRADSDERNGERADCQKFDGTTCDRCVASGQFSKGCRWCSGDATCLPAWGDSVLQCRTEGFIGKPFAPLMRALDECGPADPSRPFGSLRLVLPDDSVIARAGSFLQIRWTSRGMQNQDRFFFALVRDSAIPETLAAGPPDGLVLARPLVARIGVEWNYGKLNWLIPASILPGSYRVWGLVALGAVRDRWRRAGRRLPALPRPSSVPGCGTFALPPACEARARAGPAPPLPPGRPPDAPPLRCAQASADGCRVACVASDGGPLVPLNASGLLLTSFSLAAAESSTPANPVPVAPSRSTRTPSDPLSAQRLLVKVQFADPAAAFFIRDVSLVATPNRALLIDLRNVFLLDKGQEVPFALGLRMPLPAAGTDVAAGWPPALSLPAPAPPLSPPFTGCGREHRGPCVCGDGGAEGDCYCMASAECRCAMGAGDCFCMEAGACVTPEYLNGTVYARPEGPPPPPARRLLALLQLLGPALGIGNRRSALETRLGPRR
eukprot:tig00020603_g11795.t1